MQPMGERELARRYEELVARLAEEGVRIIPKEGVWHQHLFGGLLTLVTLGAQRAYLRGYVTTLGSTIYVTCDWDARALADRYATLRHERVHVEQFRRYGFLAMAVGYLFVPLPFGLAYVRMRLEREAYEESLRVYFALGGHAAVAAQRESIIAQFTSASYGWMWPFSRQLGRWFDSFVARLQEGSRPMLRFPGA